MAGEGGVGVVERGWHRKGTGKHFQERETGKALSIVKSVGRLPPDKIIIYAVGENGGKKGAHWPRIKGGG